MEGCVTVGGSDAGGGYREDPDDNITHRQPNGSPSWVQLEGWEVQRLSDPLPGATWQTAGLRRESVILEHLLAPRGEKPFLVASLASMHPCWISHSSSRACLTHHRFTVTLPSSTQREAERRRGGEE